MYALKREAIQLGYYPKGLPIPVFAKEFYKRVWKDGRNTESWLLVSLYLRTKPYAMMKEAILGLKLFLRGRLTIGRDRIYSDVVTYPLIRYVPNDPRGWIVEPYVDRIRALGAKAFPPAGTLPTGLDTVPADDGTPKKTSNGISDCIPAATPTPRPTPHPTPTGAASGDGSPAPPSTGPTPSAEPTPAPTAAPTSP